MIDWTAEVAGVIQRVYGDASQTVLDHRCAGQVLAVLREAGWLAPDDVARLVLAAGGEIRVPDRLRGDPLDGYRLFQHEEQADRCIVVRAVQGG